MPTTAYARFLSYFSWRFIKAVKKVNKKAILTMNTANIRRRIVFDCRKTSIFGITHKVLIISTINLFTKDKHTNHFQEPAVLETNIGVSCRWNRPFYRKKPPLFERKSMEWSHFQLLSELKDTVLCYADLANRYPSFSISSKTMKMIFIDIVRIATQ